MHEVFKLRKGCRCIQKAVYITCELIVNDYVRNRPKLSLFTDSFPSSELVKPDNILIGKPIIQNGVCEPLKRSDSKERLVH